MPTNHTSHARLDRRLERSIQDLPLRVLQALVDRPATARQLGHALGEDPQIVLGHLVDLWEDGCIELTPGVQTEDPLDRRYRVFLHFFDDAAWAEFSRAEREALSATALQVLFTEVLVAVKAAAFDARPDRHLMWKRLRLDEEGWRELTEVLRRTLSEVEALQERSRGRLVRSGEVGVDAVVSLMGFERGDPHSV